MNKFLGARVLKNTLLVGIYQRKPSVLGIKLEIIFYQKNNLET